MFKSLMDGLEIGAGGSAAGWAMTTSSSLGGRSNSVELSLSSMTGSSAGADGKGSSIVIPDKSKCR